MYVPVHSMKEVSGLGILLNLGIKNKLGYSLRMHGLSTFDESMLLRVKVLFDNL